MSKVKGIKFARDDDRVGFPGRGLGAKEIAGLWSCAVKGRGGVADFARCS